MSVGCGAHVMIAHVALDRVVEKVNSTGLHIMQHPDRLASLH